MLELFAAAPLQLTLMDVDMPSTGANAVSMRRAHIQGLGEGSHSASADGEASAAPPIRMDEEVRMRLCDEVVLGVIMDALARHQHITALELELPSPTGEFVALLAQRLPFLRRLAFTDVMDEWTAFQLLETAAAISPCLELILHTRKSGRALAMAHLRPTPVATGSASAESSPSRALRLAVQGTAASDSVPTLLQRISRLAELDLSLAHLSEESLTALLRTCPGLRSLTLRRMDQLITLACFSADPSPLPLTHLTLAPSHCMTPRELLQLRALPQLTHLSIFGPFANRLDDFTVAAHTPPSIVLPALTTSFAPAAWRVCSRPCCPRHWA